MPTPHPDDITSYCGRDFTTHDYNQGKMVISVVTAEVSAWTRGVGFDESGTPATDLWAVIVAVSARRMSNPLEVVREEMGGLVVQHAASGFTLSEQRVLNSYRETAK